MVRKHPRHHICFFARVIGSGTARRNIFPGPRIASTSARVSTTPVIPCGCSRGQTRWFRRGKSPGRHHRLWKYRRRSCGYHRRRSWEGRQSWKGRRSREGWMMSIPPNRLHCHWWGGRIPHQLRAASPVPSESHDGQGERGSVVCRPPAT